MPVRHTIVSLVFVSSLIIAGCSSDKPQTRIDWTAGQPATTTTAKESGNYALYLGNSPDAVVVQKLKQGQRMGFEKNDVGRIRAFAGSYSTTIDPMMVGQARWELMLPPQTQAAQPTAEMQ